MRGVAYLVVCLSRDEFYIDETTRPLRKGMEEHLRVLHSHQRYSDNLFSKHRTVWHTRDLQQQLQVSTPYKDTSYAMERKTEEALESKAGDH